MKDWLRRFMMGRYGRDQMNKGLLIGALAFLVLSWIVDWNLLWWLALVCLGWSYFRMLSRNIGKRQQENRIYLQKTAALRKELQFQQRKWQERKVYAYFKCPHYKAHLRVPKGKGRVMVRCNKCGREFEKVS